MNCEIQFAQCVVHIEASCYDQMVHMIQQESDSMLTNSICGSKFIIPEFQGNLHCNVVITRFTRATSFDNNDISWERPSSPSRRRWTSFSGESRYSSCVRVWFQCARYSKYDPREEYDLGNVSENHKHPISRLTTSEGC